ENGQRLPPQALEAARTDENQRNDRDRGGKLEIYKEGDTMVIEDEEGNVLKTEDLADKPPESQRDDIMEQGERVRNDASGKFAKHASQPHEKTEVEELEGEIGDAAARPYHRFKKRLIALTGVGKGREMESQGDAVDEK